MCWTPLYENKDKSYGTQNVTACDWTTQKTTKMINSDPTKTQGVKSGARKG